MKRFDLNAYTEWVCAFALTGLTLVLWAVILLSLFAACHADLAAAAEVSEPAAVEEVETPAPMEEPVVIPLAQEEDVEIDQSVLEQLAILIYREAGGDRVCDACRVRVADVALNRVADNRFPDTLAEVLTQKRQYGTMYWDGIVWPDRADNPGEAHAVDRAYRVAEDVILGRHSELYGEGYIFQSEFPKLGEQPVECCGIYYAKG